MRRVCAGKQSSDDECPWQGGGCDECVAVYLYTGTL
jgi:hypothetical protein